MCSASRFPQGRYLAFALIAIVLTACNPARLLEPTATAIPPTVTPIPMPPTPAGLSPTPTQAEKEAWQKVQCMDPASLQDFLAAYPAGGNAYEARLTLALYEKVRALQVGQAEPQFAIPFDQLGARWQAWKQIRPERGGAGYFRTEESLGILNVFPGCNTISFDGHGLPVTPTGDGSLVAFRTHSLKLEYLNGFSIESVGEEIVYFAVIDRVGLVHLYGRGKVTGPDGQETVFP
jgi:hypothetical protein